MSTLASGCAGASQAELSPLREEVAALRQAREVDRKRLESLEVQVDAQQLELRRLRGDAPRQGGTNASGLPPGGLPIVHLQPRSANELPPLPTSVSVHEPAPEVVAELEAPPQLFKDDSPELRNVNSAAGTSKEEADEIFKVAFEKLKTGELVRAAGLFQDFARRFPANPAADNALLDEGIADYGLRRYQDALDVFEELAQRYPAGDAVAEGLWRAGDCQLKLGRTAQAAATYERLIKRFPGSAEAVKAAAQLSTLDSSASHVAASEGGTP